MNKLFDTTSTLGKVVVMRRFEETGNVFVYTPGYEHPLKTKSPAWNWQSHDYNYPAEPEPPKLVPWTFETCPKGVVLLREKGGNHVELVCSWTPTHVKRWSGEWSGYGWLKAHCEHSLDNGRTWLPCGTEEKR